MELEHIVYWAIKALNMNFKVTGEQKKLQLHEMGELRINPYGNSKLYKERSK